MPIEIKAYSCQFKCGHRVLSKKRSMYDHEARCFHNPAMNACQTCRHFEPGTNGSITDPAEPGDEWWCAAFEDTFDSIGGRKFQCPRWTNKSTP